MEATNDLLRAARVLLDLRAEDVAKRAGVGTRTLVRIEAGLKVRASTMAKVQNVLEQAGAEFLPETETEGHGIRVRKDIVGESGFQIEG